MVPEKKLREYGFRFIVIDKYLLFYKIYNDEIFILRVLRGDRDYPSFFRGSIKN
jgi:plasmid stabilization system protein ParE